MRGEEISGFRVLQVESASVPNGLAATLLAIRDRTGKKPHAYFGWTEGNPLKYLARFVIFGEAPPAIVLVQAAQRQLEIPPRRQSLRQARWIRSPRV